MTARFDPFHKLAESVTSVQNVIVRCRRMRPAGARRLSETETSAIIGFALLVCGEGITARIRRVRNTRRCRRFSSGQSSDPYVGVESTLGVTAAHSSAPHPARQGNSAPGA